MSLDKSKPFGTIVGVVEEFPGARYSQDGKYFTSQYAEVARVSFDNGEPVETADLGEVTLESINSNSPASVVKRFAAQLGVEYTTVKDTVKRIKGQLNGETDLS